jgi:hypothetical protein
MKTNAFSKKHLLFALGLIVFGIVGRLALEQWPNVETITAVTLLAGSLLGGFWIVAVGLIVVAGSDIVIGNTDILYYTWSAWAAMGVLGYALRKREKSVVRHSLELTGMGLVGNLVFFAWTNFGVWHIGMLYPHTAEGLMQSYIMGLPFLKMQLVSTLMIVPVVSAVTIAAWNRVHITAESNTHATVSASAVTE